jgi:hypothetical protein
MHQTKRVALSIVCTLLAAVPALAQTFQGGIRGTIQDKSAAAISAAKVTLTDQGTGISRSTVSGNGGEYSFTAVNPATYTVSVEKPGFNQLDQKNIVVSTQEFLIVDLKLDVGDVTQTVNVTAEDVPLLETENASTGQMIDNQKLQDLPNMGRNPFYEGVKVSQNVTPGGDPKFNRMEDQSGSSQISIAGGPIRGNNYLLDGISITDSQNRAVIIPTVESVQEVKLQASTYDAEVGRTGGGTFNLFLKSGTNDFHAAAFGYTWMQDWLANTFFANSLGRNPDGTLKQPVANQPFYNYGGALGGPAFIPKLYNGKNKTFWWVTGEGYRQTEANTAVLNVPTALEKIGDFSQSYANASHTALQQMYYPTSATTRTPFPGNVIPQSQLSPVGLAMASYYPLPNLTTTYFGQPNYNATGIIYDRADQVTAKADQVLTSWWRASASYLHYGSREESNAYFGFSNPGTPGQSMLVRHVDATQVNTTLTPSPTTVVYLRFGFNRFPNKTYQLASQGIDMTKWGFPASYTSQLPYQAFPAITMTGDMSSFGAGGFNQGNFYSRSFSATVSKFMGKHSVKAGFDFRIIHDSGINTVTPGAFSFDGTFTSSTPGKTVAGTGGAIASMLLGFPASGSVTTSLPIENHVTYYGGFIHDDFRMTRKLTLNAGLRYEYETGLESELNSLVVGFDTTAINPIQSQVPGIKTPGVLQYAGQNGAGTTAMNPTALKFAPRVGFAYNLREKTTIRGGYGLYWAPFTFSLVNPLGYTYSTPYVASNNGNATPANSLSNPFPTGIQQPIGNGAGQLAGIGGQNFAFFSNSAKSTRVHQMSLDIQHELPKAFVLALGFVGSITHNLIQSTPDVNINQLPDQYLSLGSQLNGSVPNPFFGTAGGILNLASSTIPLAKTLLPYPQFGTISMQSSDLNHALYTSIYFKVQKRLGRSVNILSTITWSKNEDMSNAASNTFNSQQSTSQDNYNRAAEWGLATIDTPLRWTTAINYELPFGTGKKFLARNKFLDILVGGWAVNAQTTMQNGFPLAIYQTNQNSVIGTSVQRPNATGIDPSTSGSVEDRLNNYINKAAFSAAPQFTYGNLSRTITMRGPGQANTDFSLFKSYAAEKFKAQFRAEVFNLTNTPQFYGPTTNISSSAFGTITSQANFNRVFQLGVRFEY